MKDSSLYNLSKNVLPNTCHREKSGQFICWAHKILLYTYIFVRRVYALPYISHEVWWIRTWQRLKHGTHLLPPTFELGLNPQRKCTLEFYSQLFAHSLPTPLWSHRVCTHFSPCAFFCWTVRKPIDLDHLAQKSGDNNGPEIVATAAFLEQNTFSRKLLHLLACITV